VCALSTGVISNDYVSDPELYLKPPYFCVAFPIFVTGEEISNLEHRVAIASSRFRMTNRPESCVVMVT